MLADLGLLIFENCLSGGRVALYLFENIAGNKSLQFESQLKAHVEKPT
jgi:hypothetical protein